MFVSNVQTFWQSITTKKGRKHIFIFPTEMTLLNDGFLKCKETSWEGKINILVIITWRRVKILREAGAMVYR